jgi:hypothetical protein
LTCKKNEDIFSKKSHLNNLVLPQRIKGKKWQSQRSTRINKGEKLYGVRCSKIGDWRTGEEDS